MLSSSALDSQRGETEHEQEAAAMRWGSDLLGRELEHHIALQPPQQERVEDRVQLRDDPGRCLVLDNPRCPAAINVSSVTIFGRISAAIIASSVTIVGGIFAVSSLYVEAGDDVGMNVKNSCHVCQQTCAARLSQLLVKLEPRLERREVVEDILAPARANQYRTRRRARVADSGRTGRMKLRSDQSSLRLFWRGVPLSSKRLETLNVFSSRNSLQSLFFSRCPSSTARYFQVCAERLRASFIACEDMQSCVSSGHCKPRA
eukprot:814945-Rhodomonas_salina.1